MTDQQAPHDRLLSVIMFSYNSESRLEKSARTVLDYFEEHQVPIELVIIDDGSQDGSFAIAKRLERDYEPVRAYRLAKNVTTPYAQFAGLSVCEGACAAFCPDDLQRPLSVILEMYRLWEQGHKLVVPYRASREDRALTRFASGAYYWLMNRLSEVKFPQGGADGFLADREVIDILVNRIHPIRTSTVVEALRLGFDPVYLPYHRPPSDGPSRWTFGKKLQLASDTFFTSSYFPIRLIAKLGIVSFIFSLALIAATTYARLYANDSLFGFSIPGWTTTLIITSLFSGLNLLSLGVIAEYIWRIFEETKGRPGFIIRNDDDYYERHPSQ